MPRSAGFLAVILGLASVSAALAETPRQIMDAISRRGIGPLTPSQLLELGEFSLAQSVPEEAPDEQRVHALVKDPYFGQLVWWWAAERNLPEDAAVERLVKAWQKRYDRAPPAELEAGLRKSLVGLPPVRTLAGTVYQRPADTPTGQIYRPTPRFPVGWPGRDPQPEFLSFEFRPRIAVGWPGHDPQVLSGISRISTGLPPPAQPGVPGVP